jgi:tetratricopeptide (TPR) repeat protein
MKKELKRQIKEDEFATGLAKATEWARVHLSELKLTAGILAAIVLGAAGINYLQGSRTREAEKSFSEAFETFQASVGPAPEGVPATGQRFATAPEKYQKAAAAFDAVASKYPSLPTGKRARYYAALSRLELGELDAAEKALTEIASHRDADVLEPALARLALADLYARRGQSDKAVEAYRKLLDEPASGLPKDHVLMRLAGALEDSKKTAEAGASYKRLSEEYPESVYAGEARQRAEYLAPSQG